MTLLKITENIFIDDSISNKITKIDALIFDCDGVLIDITNSYDLAIKKTTDYVIKKIAKISNPIEIDSKIIDGFKATGGFNDEVDLTYASILSIVASDFLNESQASFITKVIQNADQTGISSVENFLKKESADISKIKKKLEYPGSHHDNLLYSIFDQLFYGPELYEKLFNKKSNFKELGLIENDKVILNNKLLSTLKKRFSSKLAIVSGRGIESVRYSLKEKLNEFNLQHSAFLEDEPREMAKPNPESLIRTIKNLESSNTLFVGDSMEDLIMAKKSSQQGFETFFCGIIGTSKNPDKKKQLFEQNQAHIILNSINELPKVLNLEKH